MSAVHNDTLLYQKLTLCLSQPHGVSTVQQKPPRRCATRRSLRSFGARRVVAYGGLRSGAIGLGAGLAASAAAQRYGVTAYRQLTLPLKAFALTYAPLVARTRHAEQNR